MWAKLLLKTWCTVIIFNTLHFFCFNLVDLPLFYLLIDATIIGLRSEIAKLVSSTEELDHMRHFKEEYEKIDKENIRYFPLRGYRSQEGRFVHTVIYRRFEHFAYLKARLRIECQMQRIASIR